MAIEIHHRWETHERSGEEAIDLGGVVISLKNKQSFIVPHNVTVHTLHPFGVNALQRIKDLDKALADARKVSFSDEYGLAVKHDIKGQFSWLEVITNRPFLTQIVEKFIRSRVFTVDPILRFATTNGHMIDVNGEPKQSVNVPLPGERILRFDTDTRMLAHRKR